MAEIVDEDQYKIVSELLARQDEVLEQLDQLNARVAAAIVEVTSNRDSDEEQAIAPSESVEYGPIRRAA